MTSAELDPTREHWAWAYREAPEIFEAFARAEDPEGLVVKGLLAHADLEGRSVLEIGAGTGRYTRDLAPHAGRYLAVEPAPRMLARGLGQGLPEGVQALRALGQRLPLRDRAIDRIVAAWVLANLRDVVRDGMLAEFRRVLRPGGCAWLAENAGEGEFFDLRGEAAVHEAGRIRHLEALGFRVIDVIPTELRFPSAEEAERVLGALCGERVAARLHSSPRARVGHVVALMRLAV